MPKSEAELNQIMLRRNYRRVLRATMEAIDIPKTHYIEPELCEKANIVQQPLSLDEESDYQPFFFDECQGNIMSYSEAGKDDPREHPPLEYDPDSTAAWNVLGLMANIELSWLDRNPLNETGGCVTVSTGFLKYTGALYEPTELVWESSELAIPVTNYKVYTGEGTGPLLPHVKCLLRNVGTGGDRLLRGEVKAIIKIMRCQLNDKRLRPHLVAPVMLLSVVSPWNVRVLESYFDGSKLVVRKTRSYDMSKEYDWTIERLWRLWHGGCIGNTTTLPEKPMTGQ